MVMFCLLVFTLGLGLAPTLQLRSPSSSTQHMDNWTNVLRWAPLDMALAAGAKASMATDWKAKKTADRATSVGKTIDCQEAKHWFKEGLALSDYSIREASYYQRAVALCPNHFRAYNRLGTVYKKWGKYDAAITALQSATRGVAFAEAHNNLGEVYRIQGRYDLAAKSFIQALRIDPDFLRAQNNLKYVQKRLGKFDRGAEAPPEMIPSPSFTLIPGVTLPEGSYMADVKYRYWVQEADPATVSLGRVGRTGSRSTSIHALIWGIRYGVTDNLTIGLIPKWFRKETRVTIPFVGVNATPQVSGFGDTTLLTKYRLWGMRRTHLSVFHLLSIPTGDENAQAESKQVIRRIPLGSGGFDYTPGLAFTTTIDPITVHANLSYVSTEQRIGGDEFHCDLAIAFPRYHDFSAGLQLNYRWVDSNTRKQLYQTRWFFDPDPQGGRTGLITQERTIKEEGGETLFLSSSMQFFLAKGFNLQVGAQFPIIRPGGAWVEDAVFHLGLSRYFF